MKTFSIVKLVISAVTGLIIGVIIIALVNLFNPIDNIVWTVVAVGVGSLLSAVAGYLIGSGRSGEKAPKPAE